MRKKGERMVLITVHLPKKYLEKLNRYVQMGYFPNVSEAIRQAIFRMLLEVSKLEDESTIV